MSAPISPALDQLIRQIGGPASPEYQNLRATIGESPVLAAQLNQAARTGELRGFGFLPPDSTAGAEFMPDKGIVRLNRTQLADPERRGELTFLLGHEGWHGHNNREVNQAYARFDREILDVSRSGAGRHDYTPAMATLHQVNRQDEAMSQLAGWNALVSRVRTADPQAQLKQIFQQSGGYAGTFIQERGENGAETYHLYPGYSLEADLSIRTTPANIEAAARHYFDRSPQDTRLGEHANSDYRNYYAAGDVSKICRLEMNHSEGRMVLDMQGLKLNERLMEENGIDLGEHRDQRCRYVTPQAPDRNRYFDHTIDTHRYRPVTQEEGPAADGQALPSAPDAEVRQPDNGLTSGDALFDQLYQAALSGSTAQMREATEAVATSPWGQQETEISRQAVEEQDRKAQELAEQQQQEEQQQAISRGPRMKM